jgi:quercetin dioxygenase-like cupin family protein
MQTKIVQFATYFSLAVAVMCLPATAFSLDSSDAVKVTPLMKTKTTWDGTQIAYPQGMAEVTAMRVEIAPGGETGWHSHSVPSFAVILEGALEVTLKDGRVKKLQAGDVLAEVVNTLHNGHNVGAVPVRLVVFYPGVVGQTLTVKAR